jgi:hypothetical protein
MDKNRFETLCHIVNLDPTVHNIQSLFTVEDLKWLIGMAEICPIADIIVDSLKVEKQLMLEQMEELRKENQSLTERFHKQADYILNLEAKIERLK